MSSARKSSAYIMASTFVSKGIAFVGSIFIARLLFPEDFGYIVFAEIISAFIMLVANCGFENFYLQEKIKDECHESEVLGVTYRLRLVFNTALFLIQLGISFVVQYVFEEEIVGIILGILSIGHLLNSITISRQYILRKKLDFRVESTANIARDAVGTIAKVGFAFLGLGAVSIALGGIVGGLARTAWFLYAFKGVVLPLCWNSSVARRVWYFGIHSFSGNIGMYLGNYIDKMLLGLTFSKAQMGLYSFAYSRADMTKAFTTRPLGSLIISWVAKHKSNKDKVLIKLARFTYLEASLLGPMMLLLLVYADVVIPAVFGEQWKCVVPLFRVFLGVQLFTCLTDYVGTVLTGFGYPKLASRLVWTKMAVLSYTLYLAASYEDIMLYGMCFCCVNIGFSLMKAYVCLRILNSSLVEFCREIRLGVILFWLGLNALALVLMRQAIGDTWISVITAAIFLLVSTVANYFFFGGKRSLDVLNGVASR
ncbi:oligosaccharide flippase family protein [Akkermansiaceae bacterium]|nr:oligosaccharide flippase family protein [Akkermansiaceae bacterium]